MQLNVFLVLLILISKLDFTFSLVSKYKPKKSTATRPKNVDSHQRESYVSGVCKTDADDLTLYKLNFDQCVEECRARTMCVSVNVYVKLDVCRINFVSHPKLGDCPKYVYSEKKNWKRKMKKGCEEQTCGTNEKCIIKDDKPKCTPSECRQISGIQNGVMFGNLVMFGKKRGFRCNKGFNLIGPTSITCLSDGNWSDDTPTCEKLTKKQKKTTQTTTLNTTTPQSTTKSDKHDSNTSIKNPNRSSTQPKTKKPPNIIGAKTDGAASDESSTDSQMTALSNTKTQTTALSIYVASTKTGIATSDKSSDLTQTTAQSNIHGNSKMNEPPCSEMGTNTSSIDRRSNAGPIVDNCRPLENGSTDGERKIGGKHICDFGLVHLVPGGGCIPPSDCVPPKAFANSYQTYLDTNINVPALYSEWHDNTGECVDACFAMDNCVALTAKYEEQFTSEKLPGYYRCMFFDMIFNIQDPNEYTGHITFVRDCSDADHDVNIDVTDSPSTWKQCELGFVYSYSTQDCMKGCIQNADSFQHYEGVRLDTRIRDETSVREGESVDNIEDCKWICRKSLECNTVTVTALYGHEHKYTCMFLDLKKLEVVPYKDSTIYRRDCL